uniref:Metalloendopeptidase n=1 Tax=Astyanax mexicanus TaxID=7994 RepID=A0A8B9LFL4_ASTMX
MEPTASLSILALLMLGLTQAVPLMEPQHVDITTRILSTNNGSRELLLEGDIVLPRTRNALVCANNNCFWKKSSTGLVQVPFTVTLIRNMLLEFRNRTSYVEKNETILKQDLEEHKCYSSVGRTGGKQVVSLSTRGCVYHGIVQHELNHALGFYHEHTRSDRDRYVTINWQNIDPTMQYNFNKENTNNLNTPYDYSSVMHYGKTAFTINGLNTITPIPDASVQIGQRVDLSVIDIQRINTLYNC